MKKRNLKKGFTIVELVIVIAVIAILSAVLIPTFGSVVANAEEAALKADAKALYTEYVAEQVEKEAEVKETICIFIDGKYYEVKNGQIVDANSNDSLVDEGKDTAISNLDLYNAPAAENNDQSGSEG